MMRKNRSGHAIPGYAEACLFGMVVAGAICTGDYFHRQHQAHLNRMETDPAYRVQCEQRLEEQKIQQREDWNRFMDTRIKYAMYQPR